MSSRPPSRKGARPSGFIDRRAPDATPGSLRWLKGLWSRPLEVVRQGADLKLRVVERRKASRSAATPTSAELRAELRACLSAAGHGHAAHAMRHLLFVHDALRRKGWAGVEALPAAVRGKAMIQAEMLRGQEALPALSHFIGRLRALQPPTGAAPPGSPQDAPLEVSEVTHEEFEAMERSWAGTIPPELLAPDAGPR